MLNASPAVETSNVTIEIKKLYTPSFACVSFLISAFPSRHSFSLSRRSCSLLRISSSLASCPSVDSTQVHGESETISRKCLLVNPCTSSKPARTGSSTSNPRSNSASLFVSTIYKASLPLQSPAPAERRGSKDPTPGRHRRNCAVVIDCQHFQSITCSRRCQ